MEGYLGIDVGSVSINLVVLDENGMVRDALYCRTQGRPIEMVQQGLGEVHNRIPDLKVKGVGATGSGRQLIGLVVGADIIKNEITAHAIAAMHIVPNVQTILEIGGQDSKLIVIRNGVVSDFAMNTVCAAGTGSFLDQQAARLGIPIEQFGDIAHTSQSPVRIAGRCAVFAESDMIHKQQTGHTIADILNGLCHALVRNYLNNVGKGKTISGPIVFQGGVAANKGMVRAFQESLHQEVVVPQHFGVMGAVGAALLAKEENRKQPSAFRGFEVADICCQPRSFECGGCANMCEVVEVRLNGEVIGRWGDRCGKWSASKVTVA